MEQVCSRGCARGFSCITSNSSQQPSMGGISWIAQKRPLQLSKVEVQGYQVVSWDRNSAGSDPKACVVSKLHFLGLCLPWQRSGLRDFSRALF